MWRRLLLCHERGPATRGRAQAPSVAEARGCCSVTSSKFGLWVEAMNRNGDAVARGSADKKDGGFTGLRPFQIWYCGKKKNECKCGNCDGRCGPTNGCPCQDCYSLIQVFVCMLLGLICAHTLPQSA